MEKIKGLNREIEELVAQIRAKRQEAIKSKLTYLQNNPDNPEAHLTEEEWEILQEYLTAHGEATSVKMQHGWYDDIDGYDTNDYEAIIRIGNKYIAVHDGMTQGHDYYSFEVSDGIEVEVDEDRELVTINGIVFVPDRNDGWKGSESIISGKQELTKGLDIESLFSREIESPQKAEESPQIDLRNLAYDLVAHRVIDTTKEDVDVDYVHVADFQDVVQNILERTLIDTKSNAKFNETTNYCRIGQYSDMPGEEEIALILNSIDREILKEYFRQHPEDRDLFEDAREDYDDVLSLDEDIREIEQPKSARQLFEESLLREDVVEYYLSKTPEELEAEFGTEVSRMVGFEQKNAHHCYDLWQHTLHTVESIDTTNLTPEQAKRLKVAAFFHDIGKPDVVGFNPRTNQQNFINHAVHSVDIARPMLEKLGYSPEEIQQISFYIGHHDDFLNYKGTLADKDKSHVFFRETTPSAVAEIVVQNQINWEKLGIDCYLPTHTGNEGIDARNTSTNNANNTRKRYICSALVNGVEPRFRDFKNQPIKVDVDMEDIRAKLATGEYGAGYIPTEEDYRLLLEICKADARAQSEEVITVNPKTKQEVVSDTRERKVATMQNIGEVIALAYREGTDKISEATKREIEEITGYSFEQFIKDSIPQALGEKRPVVICKDGTEYSIQASSFHACSPRKDGLEAYDEFEIYALGNWDDLEEFMNYDGVAGNVPLAVVEQILRTHGGLDSEKMMARIQEQKGVYQPKSAAYEKMIRDASGGNEFLEKMLRYATRRCEVRDTNDKAKQLSEEYEAQLPKDQHSLDDNN